MEGRSTPRMGHAEAEEIEMKPMRQVGPKKGYRVFDGEVFTLGFFRNRGVMKQEFPEAQARLQAEAIRQLGVNARVVKGKGWAAVYVAQKKRSKKPKTYKPKKSKMKKEWKVNVDGRNLPLTEGKAKVMGSWKFEDLEPVTTEQASLTRKGELMKGMSVRFWEDNDYFEKNGLGRLKAVESSTNIYSGDFKDNSQITEIEVINLKSSEAKEFYENFSINGNSVNRQDSFKNWLNNAGRRRERKWKNNPLLNDYFNFFKQGDPIDLDIFVVSVDNKRAFWSPIQGDFAQRSKKAIEKFKGWERFTSDGRGKRA